MDPIWLGVIGLGSLIILFFAGVPVALGFLITAAAGLLLMGLPLGTIGGIMAQMAYAWSSNYALITIPLFVLMGGFASEAGITTDLYTAAYKWLGRLPGGLAMATMGACTGFAACCGSSLASATSLGTVALPQMNRFNYKPSFSTGCIAAGGTLGILIPPSTTFILYGIITNESITKLFLAGILPGLLLSLLFMVTIFLRVKLNPELALPSREHVPWKERFTSSLGILPVIALFLFIMGGLYGGIFTPTEAAGIGAFVTFLIALFKRRLTWKGLLYTLRETAAISTMIFFIIICAEVFSYFLAVTRLPNMLVVTVGELPWSPYGVLVLILVMYMILGCVVDPSTIIILTTPLVYPIILALGFDPIWFGVIVVLELELALITPPVGLNIFALKGIAKDVPMSEMFKGVSPFLVTISLAIIVLVIFPQIALFIPNIMK